MATCESCQPDVGFSIQNPLPGVPVGRFVVPLVRVNAKVDEMKPGMVIPRAYLPNMTAAELLAVVSTFTLAQQAAFRTAIGAAEVG